jgi:hypothetical protein
MDGKKNVTTIINKNSFKKTTLNFKHGTLTHRHTAIYATRHSPSQHAINVHKKKFERFYPQVASSILIYRSILVDDKLCWSLFLVIKQSIGST